MTVNFSSAEAFERNIGLISPAEQKTLRDSLVVIAGCGGVGGLHAHTCARLGIGRFRITDADTFSAPNINRQIGATAHTIGVKKVQVTAEMIRSINPDASVEVSDGLISADNAAQFVSGADLVIDSVDFFALSARRQKIVSARIACARVLDFSMLRRSLLAGRCRQIQKNKKRQFFSA